MRKIGEKLMVVRIRKQITITLPPDIIEEIDRRRGPASRSALIERILREHLQRFEIKLIEKAA